MQSDFGAQYAEPFILQSKLVVLNPLHRCTKRRLDDCAAHTETLIVFYRVCVEHLKDVVDVCVLAARLVMQAAQHLTMEVHDLQAQYRDGMQKNAVQ